MKIADDVVWPYINHEHANHHESAAQTGMKVLVIKSILYLVLIHFATVAAQKNVTQFSYLRALNRLCPGQQVCPEALPENITDDVISGSDTGCCTSCSCDPACSHHGNCCFPEMVETNRTYEQCLYAHLYPPTSGKKPLVKSYYMIVAEPEHGCVQSFYRKYDSVAPNSCCEIDVTPWGSLHPAWSPSRRKIFKNSLYAECHGVSDAIEFDVVKGCLVTNDMADTEGCDVIFRYLNDEEIQMEQCFIEPFVKCPTYFQIRPKLQFLTSEDVIHGCESNFTSPLNYWFNVKNVFCYICFKSPYGLREPGQCSKSDGIRGFNRFPYVSVLKNIDLRLSRTDKKHVQDRACRMKDGHVIINTCRDIICPLGQTSNYDDQGCHFYSRSLEAKISTYIMLTIDEPTEEVRYTDVRSATFQSNLFVSLSDDWVVKKIFIPEIDDDNDISTLPEHMLTRPLTHMFFFISYRTESVDPSKVFSQLATELEKKWLLKFANKIVPATAEINQYTILPVVNFANAFSRFAYRESFAMIKVGNGSGQFKESMNFIAIYLADSNISSDIYKPLITKLFFCQLVILREDEFELFETDWSGVVVLLVMSNNKYLYNLEFKIHHDSNGVLTARVCLEDSGLLYLPSIASRLDLLDYIVIQIAQLSLLVIVATGSVI